MLKFSCYRSYAILKQRYWKNIYNFKNVVFYKQYVYFDIYRLLVFIKKLRITIKQVIQKQGKFFIFSENWAISNFIRSWSFKLNQFSYVFHKNLFSSTFYLHNFFNIKDHTNLWDLTLLSAHGNLGFIVLLLETNHNLYQNKVLTSFKLQGYPTLYISQDGFSSDYFLPSFSNLKSNYYWLFAVLNLVQEELNFKI